MSVEMHMVSNTTRIWNIMEFLKRHYMSVNQVIIGLKQTSMQFKSEQKLFWQENGFENAVCKTTTVLISPQCLVLPTNFPESVVEFTQSNLETMNARIYVDMMGVRENSSWVQPSSLERKWHPILFICE